MLIKKLTKIVVEGHLIGSSVIILEDSSDCKKKRKIIIKSCIFNRVVYITITFGLTPLDTSISLEIKPSKHYFSAEF